MTEPQFVDYIQGIRGDYSRKDAEQTYKLFKEMMAREPIRGSLIMPVYADSCYTHKGNCVLCKMNKPSRKLGITFTSKPCRIIKPPGKPKPIPGLFYD